jgi:hypothetical protein
LKKVIAALAGLAVFAPSALAASHFIKVTPGKVAPGKTITISGSVDHGCQIGHKGDSATLFSKGFKGATKQNFAGVPSISVSLAKSKDGAFSKKLKLSKKLKKGTYTVSGRCGGGNFGSAKFKVAKSGVIGGGGGGGGFY